MSEGTAHLKDQRNPRPKPLLPSKAAAMLEKIIRPQMDTRIDVSFILLAAVTYGVLFFSIGTSFLPGHAAWCTLLLWASSLIGALIANQLFLPRVIGMLAAGILLRNIPWSAIDAFPAKWGTQMRAAALATIFLRCGLELDFGTMRRYKFPAIRLALLPGLAEALYVAGLGVALFNMSFTLALSMGFILKAVGPGLVVPAMFRLQKAKIGTDQGIPSVVVIAASFDDIVAITGYAIFSTIAIQPYASSDGSGSNAAWSIASGPAQVVFGILGGIIVGVIVGASRIWDTQLKRFVALFGGGLLLMFFLVYWDLLSGGALGALFTGLIASNLWEKGLPRRFSQGPSFVYSPQCECWMSVVWRWIMEPILFVTVGSTLNFSTISGGTVPRSVCIVLTGVVLRTLCTFLAMSGFKYTNKEKIFFALAWTPKATVQAALSAAPLTLITTLKAGAPDYEQWVAWGNDILTTGLFAILLCGTLGVIAIHFFAPVLLTAAKETERKEEESEGTDEEGAPVPSEGGAVELAAWPRVPSRLSLDSRIYQRRASSAQGAYALTDLFPTADMAQAEPMKRAASADIQRRPPSPQATSGGRLIPGEDLGLVAEYIDSIQRLTMAVNAGEQDYSRDEVMQLSDRVLDLQHRLENEVGRREPSVRELFRTASVLTTRRQQGPREQRPGAVQHRNVRTNSVRQSQDGSVQSRQTKHSDDPPV